MEIISVSQNNIAGSSIRYPALLHIQTEQGISYGGNQAWYPNLMGRMGGCGPTTAANILWYLAASPGRECKNLFQAKGSEQREMLRLMRAVWPYVKPGMKGVDKSSMLTEGVLGYGAKQGVMLSARTLEIPQEKEKRLGQGEVLDFLRAAFADDLPVAFLNLHNGELENLESWHWVTLISIDSHMQAQMYDQSRREIIQLGQWLSQTTKGGAFVVIEPEISKE